MRNRRFGTFCRRHRIPPRTCSGKIPFYFWWRSLHVSFWMAAEEVARWTTTASPYRQPIHWLFCRFGRIEVTLSGLSVISSRGHFSRSETVGFRGGCGIEKGAGKAFREKILARISSVALQVDVKKWQVGRACGLIGGIQDKSGSWKSAHSCRICAMDWL